MNYSSLEVFPKKTTNDPYPLKTATMVGKQMETKFRYNLRLTVIIKEFPEPWGIKLMVASDFYILLDTNYPGILGLY